MRVIAGEYGGRVLKSRILPELRPTSDRVRESVFSTLESLGVFSPGGETFVLDLYAGLGSLGIEALSRGASQACFVELRRKTVELLRENLSNLGIPASRCEVIQMDVEQFLAQVRADFDLVFADPPYSVVRPDAFLSQMLNSGVLSSGGLLIFEVPKGVACDDCVGGNGHRLSLVCRKIYGDTTVRIYRKLEGDDED